MLIVLRSLPTFFRKNAMRLGGNVVAGGIVVRRLTTSWMGKGASVFGLGGKN